MRTERGSILESPSFECSALPTELTQPFACCCVKSSSAYSEAVNLAMTNFQTELLITDYVCIVMAIGCKGCNTNTEYGAWFVSQLWTDLVKEEGNGCCRSRNIVKYS